MSLYALKPWYADLLSAPRDRLAARGTDPLRVTWSTAGAGALAGLALALLPTGPAALVVAPVLAGRLALANLDGGLARQTGRTTRWGAVAGELADRGADLAALAGCLALAPPAVVLLAGLAASLPSLVSLAGAAAGLPRLQSGPVGKVERCVLLVAVAAVGHAAPLLLVLTAGSLVTAVRRAVLLRSGA